MIKNIQIRMQIPPTDGLGMRGFAYEQNDMLFPHRKETKP